MKAETKTGELLGATGHSLRSPSERIATAAEETALELRKFAMNPQVDDHDRPGLLMSALGWDEFARQMRKVEH